MITLNQLEQLICIVESGTVSEAAQHLSISQPALSRSIQRLEEEIHVQLFDHYKNKIVLNKNGEFLYQQSKKMLKEIDNMIKDVQKLNHSMITTSIASCAPGPMWKLEETLKQVYPQLQVISTIEDQQILMTQLKEQQCQMIITPFEIKDPDIFSIPYLKEELFISLPLTHPFKDQTSVSFKDLDGQTMLLYSKIGFWYDLHVKTMPHTTFLFQDERFIFKEVVKASSLPSFTSNISIEREGKMKNRIILPIEDEEARVQFFISMLKDNKDKYQQLLTYLEK